MVTLNSHEVKESMSRTNVVIGVVFVRLTFNVNLRWCKRVYR